MSAGLPVTEKPAIPTITGKEKAATVAGLPVTENYRLQYCQLQRNLLFPSLLVRNQLQIQCLQQVHRLQRFPGYRELIVTS